MMMKKLKLKILALGNQMMLRRLAFRLNREEISITGCSSVADATGILTREHFDMVIIDNLIKDLEAVCRNTATLAKAPVALILQEKTADWRKAQNLIVDGFLPDEAGSLELTARIKAYLRRRKSG